VHAIFSRIIMVVCVCALALVILAAAQVTECEKPCSCMSPEEAKSLGYTLCGGKEQLCGYDRFRNPLYCYGPAPEQTPGLPTCPAYCECMYESDAEKLGYTPCDGKLTICGYDRLQNPLFCYEPSATPTPAAVPCPATCECMPPALAKEYGFSACPNAPNPCGFDARGNPEYCYLPPATTFGSCPRECECMHPEEALERGFVSCPGTKEPCGMVDNGELLYCYQEPRMPTIPPTTQIITLAPTYVAVTPTPTPTQAILVIPTAMVAVSFPTCYDGIRNQDETGIDCGGTHCPPCNRCDLASLPAQFDWRNYVTLPPIKSQGSCGSCWAFSAIGAIEGTSLVEHGSTEDFSEQTMVSNCGCSGSCSGGWPHNVLKFVRNEGVPDEACFPYVASNVACSFCAGWQQRLWVIGYYGNVGSGIDEIKRALICHGPLSVCSEHWSHCIVLVGYDDSTGTWIIRNSHGTGYGTGGYGAIPYSGHSYSDIKNYVKYISGVGTGFQVNFEENDGLAAGDLNNDGIDEIIHGDRGDRIRVYTMSGTKLADWTLDFEEKDGLAAGDVNGDGYDEIVHGDRDDKIRVFSMGGSKLAEWNMNFEGGDGLSVGDVNGDGYDEIVHGDRDDRIRVYTMTGITLADWTLNFEENDGLAVGDVNGDGIDEIIHGDRGDRIRVYSMSGTMIADWSLNFEEKDGLAAGDLNNDGTEVIIHYDRGNWIRVYTMNGVQLEEFRFDFEGGDGFAAGDVDGDGRDEILHGDRGDFIKVIHMYGGV
jgi:C1A family cysteine protease